MPIYVILAAAVITLSMALLAWSLAGSRKPARAAASNLSRGGMGGMTDARQLALTRSASERAVEPVGLWLVDRARRLTPRGWIEPLERRITLAGRPAGWPLERVLAGKLILGVAAFLVGIVLFADGLSTKSALFWVGLTALGYFGPDLVLRGRGAQRQKEIARELPDTLDQMTIAVEAGLGFESAMARAGRTGTGPLAEELVRTLQEMQVGVARPTAMRNLSGRTDVSDLRRFTFAVIQAERYGIPIADVLKTQAAELRLKRRQRAEERAMKIPVKIIFPLVLCILPTLFIIIMGPAGIRIARTLGGG